MMVACAWWFRSHVGGQNVSWIGIFEFGLGLLSGGLKLEPYPLEAWALLCRFEPVLAHVAY